MTVGYGEFDMSCPKSEAGHEFEKASVDDLRHCRHCGVAGRGKASFMSDVTAARTAFFDTLGQPLSSHGTARAKR